MIVDAQLLFFHSLDVTVEMELPQPHLYNFAGHVQLQVHYSSLQKKENIKNQVESIFFVKQDGIGEPAGLVSDNLLLRGCTLMNTGWILGEEFCVIIGK